MNTNHIVANNMHKVKSLNVKLDSALSAKDYGLATVIENRIYALVHKVNLIMEYWK